MRLAVLFLLVNFKCFSQNDLRKIALSDLPKEIQEIQNISSAVRWTDSLGDNIMVLTRPDVQKVPEGKLYYEAREQMLKRTVIPRTISPEQAFHFLMIHDSAVLTWKAMGIFKLCDAGMNFSKNWFVVTDLNKNARAEVWLIYKVQCEDSTEAMKITLMENTSKCSVNGKIEGLLFNENNFDREFTEASDVFKQYAIRLWKFFASKN